MDFDLTEDQKMILDLVDEVSEKEIAPVADEIAQRGEFPRKNIEKLASLDLFGITIPKEYGGLGMDYLTWALVAERLSRACATTGLIFNFKPNWNGVLLLSTFITNFLAVVTKFPNSESTHFSKYLSSFISTLYIAFSLFS